MSNLNIQDDSHSCFSVFSRPGANIFIFSDEQEKYRAISKHLFGLERMVSDYYGLTGAIGRTQLYVGVCEKALYLEYYEHEIIGLTGSCFLNQDQNQLILVNRNCRILSSKMRGKGIGFLWFRRQKEACEKLGVDKIFSFASRSPESCGYYSLPRYGFDTDIPHTIRQELPWNLKKCRTILQLFETPLGRTWWKRHGTSLEVVFDMSVESHSQKTFAAYLNETHRMIDNTSSNDS